MLVLTSTRSAKELPLLFAGHFYFRTLRRNAANEPNPTSRCRAPGPQNRPESHESWPHNKPRILLPILPQAKAVCPFGAPEQGDICDDPHSGACAESLDGDEQPTSPQSQPKPEISAAQLAANRANAKLSTGPISSEDKAKVSQNAVKNALRGRTIVLPFDDVDAYQALLLAYQKEFQPTGPVETGLVQSLVDTCWRLERIPGLEYALVENGYNQLGHENPDVALNTPEASLELHIRLVHEKTFRNLQLQENRLVRRREKEMKELRTLQETRKAKEAEELKAAAQAALVAQHQNQPFDPTALGFVFSTQQFSSYMARLTPSAKQSLLKEALGQVGQTTETMQEAA